METHHLFSLPRTVKWRAKLCRMGYDCWQVFEEGNVYGEFDEVSGKYSLVMEDQYNPARILFKSVIRAPVAFQKQDALLLWTGPSEDIHSEQMKRSGVEFWQDESGLARVAFAFQVVPGCALMSEFVLYAISKMPEKRDIIFAVQQPANEPSSMASSSVSSPMDTYAEIVEDPVKYPPMPTQHNLIIVHNCVENMLKSSFSRELLVVFLSTKNYLNRLWDVFEEIVPQKSASADQAMSPLERIQLLWTISDIVKLNITSGDAVIIEQIVEHDTFVKCLRMLEYDRGFGIRKANFYDYYSQQTGMKQVIEMNNTPILEKIQRTFRLQMLRDVLVRTCDDVTYTILRQLININHADILENLQNSPKFCDELFSLFIGSDREPLHCTLKARDNAVEFINEVMKTSKNFPIVQLKSLYLSLLDSGLLSAIAYGLHPERRPEVKLLTLETLSLIVDLDPSLMSATHGTTILQAIVSMVYDIQPGSGVSSDDIGITHATTTSTSRQKITSRAVQLESSDLLKKILTDYPRETYDQFFEFFAQGLSRSLPTADNVERMLPILDIVTHCFSLNPELSGSMMLKFELWYQISRSTDICAKQLGPVFDSKLSMALTRLMREALQPTTPMIVSTVASQARSIIDSGLAAQTVERVCARPIREDAEHSSFASLLQMVVDGRNSTDWEQFKVFGDWLATTEAIDLKRLCTRYPIVKQIISNQRLEFVFKDKLEVDVAQLMTEDQTRKRSSSQIVDLGTDSASRRPKLANRNSQWEPSYVPDNAIIIGSDSSDG